MRWRAGRPRLSNHAALFDLPDAGPTEPGITFAGVSTLLLDDGASALLTDGYFSRPSFPAVAWGQLRSDQETVAACLQRLLTEPARIPHLEAVICLHTHIDHALDSGVIARRTGALLVGGTSAANIGRGAGLPEDRLLVTAPNRTWSRGPWTVHMIPSAHCPPDRFPGSIDRPLAQPAKAAAYRCGEAWSVAITHDSGRRALIQGSAGYIPGALAGVEADVVYLGVGQLGVLDRRYLEEYWEHTVRAVEARTVVLIHWDDFFKPLPMTPEEPALRALPYLVDDLDRTIEVLGELAAADGVRISMPQVWHRADPWAEQPSVHPGEPR